MKAKHYLREKRESKGKLRDESAHALEDYLRGQGMDAVTARRCRLRLDRMANEGKSAQEIEKVLRAEFAEFKALAKQLEGEETGRKIGDPSGLLEPAPMLTPEAIANFGARLRGKPPECA